MTSRVPPAGAHGGDGARVAAALGVDPAAMIDLSASMNPFAPDVVALLHGIPDRLGAALQRYPDSQPATDAVAAAIGVDPDVLVLTNGGAEAIALVAAEVRTANIVEPEFSLYRRHLTAHDDDAPRWRSNPSSPLGQLAGPDEIAGVWDEAFYPLATGSWTRGDAEAWRVGSMTKLWNCPGLRLGYVIAPDAESARRLSRRQPQWAVNALALDVVPDLLDRTDLAGWSDQIGTLRNTFIAALRDLGFLVRDTVTNWVLVDHADLRASLAVHHVLVRDCTSFGMPGVHRVALPTPLPVGRSDRHVHTSPAAMTAVFPLNGVVFTTIGVSAAIGTGLVLRSAVGRTLSTTIATTICVAGRMLDTEARAVAQLLDRGDLPAARIAVRSLVGRTTDELDAADLSRAVVESLAENGVDAVTSSLCWAIAGGAPAVLAHRAINTLDAMVGHHTPRYEHFGWASARLDDLANFVPARLTAVAVALARPKRTRAVWRTVRADAGQHPSPNGGVIEAAFAAALDVQLGGTNRYNDHIEHRGTLGTGAPPTPRMIDDAIRLRRHTTAATITLLTVITSTVARLRLS